MPSVGRNAMERVTRWVQLGLQRYPKKMTQAIHALQLANCDREREVAIRMMPTQCQVRARRLLGIAKQQDVPMLAISHQLNILLAMHLATLAAIEANPAPKKPEPPTFVRM